MREREARSLGVGGMQRIIRANGTKRRGYPADSGPSRPPNPAPSERSGAWDALLEQLAPVNRKAGDQTAPTLAGKRPIRPDPVVIAGVDQDRSWIGSAVFGRRGAGWRPQRSPAGAEGRSPTAHARQWADDEVRADPSDCAEAIPARRARRRARSEDDARPDGGVSRRWRANRNPRLRQLVAAVPPRAGRPQPRDQDAGVGSCEVRRLFEVGEEAARTRRSRVSRPVRSAAARGRVRTALNARFAPRRMLVEHPVELVQNNGQVLHGWIDLLLETEVGWIVVDHKSSPRPRTEWADEAVEHSGQVAAYARALRRAGLKCAGCWLHFPVGGGLVEVVIDEESLNGPSVHRCTS